MAFFRLIRLPNLLIVALTQYLIYFQLIHPSLVSAGLTPVFDQTHLAFFVGVTLLITAFGYLVNDINDYDIDLINRPERVVLESQVSFQTAYWLSFFLVFSGFIAATYLAFYVKKIHLLGLYPLAVGGLLLYSTRFKRQPLLGNMLIAAYCAGSAAVLWLAEEAPLRQLTQSDPDTSRRIWSLFLWYLVFAFLVTFYRELVKDLEDVKGDREANCQTAPIFWGEEKARWIGIGLGCTLLFFLAWYSFQYREVFSTAALIYLTLAIAAPTLLSLLMLYKARQKEAYHRISQLIKLIILTGLLLILFF